MGSDDAIEAADIVLIDDDIRKIASLVKIARKTLGIVKQNIVFALAMSILNLLKIRKVSGFKIDFVSTFGKPFAAAAVMGIVTFGVFRLFDTLIGGRVIPVCISLFVAILVYAVVMLKIGTLSEDDILDLPMGGRILRISKKFHLLPAVKVEE